MNSVYGVLVSAAAIPTKAHHEQPRQEEQHPYIQPHHSHINTTIWHVHRDAPARTRSPGGRPHSTCSHTPSHPAEACAREMGRIAPLRSSVKGVSGVGTKAPPSRSAVQGSEKGGVAAGGMVKSSRTGRRVGGRPGDGTKRRGRGRRQGGAASWGRHAGGEGERG